MIPAYYFLDPAFVSTNNIDNYNKDELFTKLTIFYNKLREIEEILLSQGNKQSVFKIPFRKDILNECYSHKPALDEKESSSFLQIFQILKGRYFVYCNIDSKIDNNEIYDNPYVPNIIKNIYNHFLNNCQHNTNINHCNCEKIVENPPIFFSTNSLLDQETKFIPFYEPNDFIKYFPLLNIYPLEADINDIKEKKLILILEFFILKNNNNLDLSKMMRRLNQSINNNNQINQIKNFKIRFLYDLIKRYIIFLPEFWESEILYYNDTKLKLKIIEVLVNLLINPESVQNRRHKLNETIQIYENKRYLEQIDVFQSYRFQDRTIFPRIRFIFYKNQLILKDIINRH